MPNAAARTLWGRALRQGQTKGMGDAAPWLQKCLKMQCTKVKKIGGEGARVQKFVTKKLPISFKIKKFLLSQQSCSFMTFAY